MLHRVTCRSGIIERNLYYSLAMHMQIDYALVMEAITIQSTYLATGVWHTSEQRRQSLNERIVSQHGVSMRASEDGRTEACNVLVDAHGTVRHEWTDITGMTAGELYRWLGY